LTYYLNNSNRFIRCHPTIIWRASFVFLKIHLNLSYLPLHFSNEHPKFRTPTQKYDNIGTSQNFISTSCRCFWWHRVEQCQLSTGTILAPNVTYICQIVLIVLEQTHGTDGHAHHCEANSSLRRKNKTSKYYTLMENWRCVENISVLVRNRISRELKAPASKPMWQNEGYSKHRRLDWITVTVYDLTQPVWSSKFMRNRIICHFIYIIICLLNSNILNHQPPFQPAKPGTWDRVICITQFLMSLRIATFHPKLVE